MKLIDLDSLGVGMANPAMFENRAHADGWNSLYAILQQAPVVDAEPVRHGRWIAIPSSDMVTGKAYKCSECNKMRYGSFMPNYCQNCGAKMDGEPDV